MKREVSEMADVKSEPDELHQTVAALVAQQVAIVLQGTLKGGSAVRFGCVAFEDQEKQSVNAFLHQKLGKDSIARRPGPGGRKLTYIESCKAIELANRAFGFNGWSCRIVECKMEYKEKKGDRWSIAYSSLVRIELKDGTSHEDVGFGTSDGQKDLGAALEQAKKASISDARKRALRLFGEYLGNSCYDKDHIKDVNSNRPMAPVSAAPNVILPGQRQQVQGAAVTAECVQQIAPHPPLQFENQQQQLPQPVQQQPFHPSHHQQHIQQHAPHQQAQQQNRQLIQQSRPQMQYQPQPWKPPQVMRHPNTTAMPQHTQTRSGVSATETIVSAMQLASSNTTEIRHGAFAAPATSSSPVCPQPRRWGSLNAPRVTSAPVIVKVEQSVTAQTPSKTQFIMEDLSLSQFDYDPNTENDKPTKKMRS